VAVQKLGLGWGSHPIDPAIEIFFFHLFYSNIHPFRELPFPARLGWALYNQFRPVMRKPTIQAKPKIHKPVIPVGGKIVSTISAQTYQTATQEEKVSTKDPSPVPQQNSIPLKTSLNDVNGFADLPLNAKVTILFLRKCYDFSYPMIPPNGNPKNTSLPPG
jgi:hypothetical protein